MSKREGGAEREEATEHGGPLPQILPNGDVLVPDPSSPNMVRIAVGETHHAEWVAHIQRGGR